VAFKYSDESDPGPYPIPPEVLLRALKNYGMILGDNSSDNFISGAPAPRWDPDILRQLMRVTTKDLQVVEMKNMAVHRRR
jgi:hypothetical protein